MFEDLGTLVGTLVTFLEDDFEDDGVFGIELHRSE